MLRPLGVLSLTAVLAAPVAAADPPVIINLPSDMAKLTGQPAPPPPAQPAADAKLPEIINLPSGTDGTKAAPAKAPTGVRPTYAIGGGGIAPAVHAMVGDSRMTNYAGPTSNYYASSLIGGGMYDMAFGGFPGYSSSFYGGGFYGGGYYPSAVPSNAYFYTFAPSAVLYRDILTTPLGKTFRLPPGGIAVPNAVGVVGYVAQPIIIR
jgi:hypothetical protein